MKAVQTLSVGNETIILEGDLTLPRAEELKGLFVKALATADSVHIRFGAVHDVDLSLLQLFCSAHRSAESAKKQLTIEGAAPKTLTEAANAAGYSRLTGCKLDSDKTCLWVAIAGTQRG